MTTQKTRVTRPTANAGKPASTKEKAAEKLTIRPEVQKTVKALKSADTRLANLVLSAATLARQGDLNDKEKKALFDAIPRQRKADFRAIVEAPANYLEEKECPKGLQGKARYVKFRAEGFEPAVARDIANNKLTKKAAIEKRDGKPETGKASEPETDTGKGTDTRTNPDPDEVGGLYDLEKAIAKLRREVQEYGPEARKAFNRLAKVAEEFSDAMANG